MPIDIFELARRQNASLNTGAEHAIGGKTPFAREEDSSTLAPTREDVVDATYESVLLVCGSTACGKSSLIRQFLSAETTQNSLNQVLRGANGNEGGGGDDSAAHSNTIALDYNYGWRQRGAGVRELVHVWELGGGGRFAPLLTPTLSSLKKSIPSLILILDPTSVGEWPATVQPILDAINQAAEIKSASHNASEQQQRAGDHRIHPLPLPAFLVLVAKYDVLQQMDTERRTNIYRLLRYFAHYRGATLLTAYSTRIDGLALNARRLFAQMAFPSLRGGDQTLAHALFASASSEQSTFLKLSSDVHAPINIPAGLDSFEKIGMAPNALLMTPGWSGEGMAQWAEELQRQFPSNSSTTASQRARGYSQSTEGYGGEEDELNMVNSEKFAEPLIDRVVEESKRALNLYTRERRDREEVEKMSRLHKKPAVQEENYED